jgi:hypothetical protein
MAARFSTTVGAEARTVSGTVYAAALAPGGEVRVLWVKVDERLYPTGKFVAAKLHDGALMSWEQYIRYGTTRVSCRCCTRPSSSSRNCAAVRT